MHRGFTSERGDRPGFQRVSSALRLDDRGMGVCFELPRGPGKQNRDCEGDGATIQLSTNTYGYPDSRSAAESASTAEGARVSCLEQDRGPRHDMEWEAC